ncbi:MAG: NAD-dependent epimerase/dehydratase family protein [Mangrovibacterium sp.]
MNNNKLLITGVTGFLGAHAVEFLLADGYEVLAIKRRQSKLFRCTGFIDRVKWVDIEDEQLGQVIIDFKPNTFLHFAWNGVIAAERTDWEKQIGNIDFTFRLLELSQKAGISKFICIGSQAEYGQFSGRIGEEAVCRPVCAYGSVKLATSYMVKTFCEQNDIEWYWLRQFSVFGPKEEPIWVLSAAIVNLLQHNEMQLTGCEQRYDYIYVTDFARAISKVVKAQGQSGIYNLSSNQSVTLRGMLEQIREQITPDMSLLKFGALPYRPNQVMHMEGNSSKFYKTFGFKIESDLKSNIRDTIEYYKKQIAR